MLVWVWQRAVTMIHFCPVLDQAWEALVEVDHDEEVPSPQLKLYSTVCPRLDVEGPTEYEYDVP
jgi:hypothetical protein